MSRRTRDKHRFTLAERFAFFDRKFLQIYREEARLRQKGRCFYCRVPLTKMSATAEHKRARSIAGLTTRKNIKAACKSCNAIKGQLSAAAFKRLIKAPPPGASIYLWLAHARRRIWIRQERAENRILRFVGLGG